MGKSLISTPSWVNRLCKSCFFFPQLVQPFQTFQSTEKVPDRVGVCGDGKVQAGHGEECDDGNQIVTDACLSELNATLAHLIALKNVWFTDYLDITVCDKQCNKNWGKNPEVRRNKHADRRLFATQTPACCLIPSCSRDTLQRLNTVRHRAWTHVAEDKSSKHSETFPWSFINLTLSFPAILSLLSPSLFNLISRKMLYWHLRNTQDCQSS